ERRVLRGQTPHRLERARLLLGGYGKWSDSSGGLSDEFRPPWVCNEGQKLPARSGSYRRQSHDGLEVWLRSCLGTCWFAIGASFFVRRICAMHRAKRYRTTFIGCSLAALLSASLFVGAGDSRQHRKIRENNRERPASDHPDEALKFRNLQLQDERGHIPLDGLQKAKEHIEGMKAAQQKRLKTQSRTGAKKGVQPQAAGVRP